MYLVIELDREMILKIIEWQKKIEIGGKMDSNIYIIILFFLPSNLLKHSENDNVFNKV